MVVLVEVAELQEQEVFLQTLRHLEILLQDKDLLEDMELSMAAVAAVARVLLGNREIKAELDMILVEMVEMD
jgi:hypothetical protein